MVLIQHMSSGTHLITSSHESHCWLEKLSELVLIQSAVMTTPEPIYLKFWPGCVHSPLLLFLVILILSLPPWKFAVKALLDEVLELNYNQNMYNLIHCV